MKIRVVIDEDQDLSWLEQWDTPETYAGNETLDDDGKPMPFDEYMQTYGDPNRHVTYGVIVEKKADPCGTCGHAETLGDSIWGVDFMDWNDPGTGEYESLDEISDPYIRELATDLLAEIEGTP